MVPRNMTSPVHLSIVIPTHRRPRLLPRAVGSALAASGPGVEVLVVADRDESAAQTLARWADDPRLRLLHSDGPGGAAATRNCGVAAARGAVLLFLDDDDELIAGYPDRVLAVAGQGRAVWGFAGQLRRMADDAPPERVAGQGWAGGLPDRAVPFRRKMAGLSCGAWVRRDLFLALGGLCVEQALDEDFDLCCRLLAAGHQPWFEPEPAVILDRVDTTVRLTNSADLETRSACSLRTFLRNAHALRHERGAMGFLAFRAQKVILRSGRRDLLEELYRNVPAPVRIGLRAKRMATVLRGRAR